MTFLKTEGVSSIKNKNVSLLIIFIIIFILLTLLSGNKVVKIDNAADLMKYFSRAVANKEIILASGIYELDPIFIIDETCGNCENPDQPVVATAGLIISGKNITLSGPEDKSAVIVTNSGYGIYLLNCEQAILKNLTITGGTRDSSALATDAAIVVKNSTAIVKNNLIQNNIGDSLLIEKNIVGIMGICGRENSRLEISNNRILNNSWDGIALYRDAEAVIEENVINGIVNVAREAGGGRGVGIGVTWNARAEITHNLIKNYWKGIGLFVNAHGVVRGNFIENCLTWGISLWDAGKGKPRGFIEANIIFDTGAMGMSVTSSTQDDPGYFKDNIVVKTGQNPAYDAADYYGFQCALALHSVPENFEITENIFYNNRRASEDLPNYDLSQRDFYDELEKRKTEIFELPLKQESGFYRLYFLK